MSRKTRVSLACELGAIDGTSAPSMLRSKFGEADIEYWDRLDERTDMTQQLDLFSDLSAFEGTDVEYKGAKGGLPADLWHTYSAFANTDGGTIYLGITQRPEGLLMHGLENPEKLLGDFWNTVNNRGKVNRNLITNADVSLLALPESGKRLIAIRVPRADRHQRPIFVGPEPFSGTYRRNFEGDYRCSEAEVRRMFSDQSEEPADSRILHGFTIEDLSQESLSQFRNRFQSRAPAHPWLAKDDLGLLEQLGGWRRDRTTRAEGLTLAGLLMFGSASSIQATEALPAFHLDYRERLSDDPGVRWSDRLTIDGTWDGNLFQFYQKVMTRFAADPGLKRPFSQNHELVRPLVTPVHDALQEALVNALIHADYSGQGGVIIERYPDRFEFSNPGTLLVSLEQILRGSVSECRNLSLQRMFQMLGVGDKAGSGIDKIRNSWAERHWQSPRLEETQRPDRVKLSLPMVSMLPEDILSDLQERFGDRFASLGKHAIQTLATVAVEGTVSNQRLQEILTLHRRDITHLLQWLVREEFLVSEGFGRWTSYQLGEGIPASFPPPKPAFPPLSGQIPPLKTTSLPPRGGELAEASEAPENDPTLIRLAYPVYTTDRAKPETVRSTILALCAHRFLTLRDLAALLGRSPESLREKYVSPMLKEGALALRYPDQLSHKFQAYRAVPDR